MSNFFQGKAMMMNAGKDVSMEHVLQVFHVSVLFTVMPFIV